MKNVVNDFGPFDGRIWLNTASEGPLPKPAVQALQEAVEWKTKPYQLTHRRFQEIPRRLKAAIGRLLSVSPEDVILGNSATYGIDLLANGLPLNPGDEIILMQNDFPTSILPWLALQDKGVVVQQVRPQNHVLSVKEITAVATTKTKLVCVSHVHTFSGHMTDLIGIGEFCRGKGIIFVANCAQSVGCMPMDIPRLPVDALTVAGFKWLCGPYGTGFCWMRPELRKTLKLNHAFWVNSLSAKELESNGEMRLPTGNEVKHLDVFGTANFFNFCPWAASIEYLLDIGIPEIWAHNQGLVEQFIQSLDSGKFQLISPAEPGHRSGLVVFSHRDPARNPRIFESLVSSGIYPAMWKGNLRISPHLFNTADDINSVVSKLNLN